MPFTHHSHSGQFCPGHARDSLEDVVLTAISHGMQVLAMTEHMPRHELDRYPEETGPSATLAAQIANEDAYVQEALRLREKYHSQLTILIGFEGEWIRPESENLVGRSIAAHPYDFFIGSVHHVHTIPIDYDDQMYRDAREKAGGTDERLFEDYFDAQFAMLQALKPPVVGHFDLIRLKSDHPDGSLQGMAGVWQRVLRNLDFIASYHGVLEINSASLRKGMAEPYPKAEVCQVALEKGIRFCLSDDSHGMDQVALNYGRVLHFLEKVGVKTVTYLKQGVAAQVPAPERFRALEFEGISMDELRGHRFWTTASQKA